MAKKYWTYKGKRLPVKKYYPPTKKTSEQQYRELVRKVGQANKRLRAIKNEFGTLGWAGETLKNKTEMNLIKAWTSRGIRVNKKMSEEQQKAVLKAINNFLKSRTSSVSGIKKTIKSQQEALKVNLDISTDESKTLYKFFEDKDFNYVTNYIDASSLFVLLEDSKEEQHSENDFIKRIENYILVGEDENVRNALKRIYNNYVRS